MLSFAKSIDAFKSSFDLDNLSVLSFSLSVANPSLSKFSIKNPTATINAPIPVAIKADLNVCAAVAPFLNPAAIVFPSSK